MSSLPVGSSASQLNSAQNNWPENRGPKKVEEVAPRVIPNSPQSFLTEREYFCSSLSRRVSSPFVENLSQEDLGVQAIVDINTDNVGSDPFKEEVLRISGLVDVSRRAALLGNLKSSLQLVDGVKLDKLARAFQILTKNEAWMQQAICKDLNALNYTHNSLWNSVFLMPIVRHYARTSNDSFENTALFDRLGSSLQHQLEHESSPITQMLEGGMASYIKENNSIMLDLKFSNTEVRRLQGTFSRPLGSLVLSILDKVDFKDLAVDTREKGVMQFSNFVKLDIKTDLLTAIQSSLSEKNSIVSKIEGKMVDLKSKYSAVDVPKNLKTFLDEEGLLGGFSEEDLQSEKAIKNRISIIKSQLTPVVLLIGALKLCGAVNLIIPKTVKYTVVKQLDQNTNIIETISFDKNNSISIKDNSDKNILRLKGLEFTNGAISGIDLGTDWAILKPLIDGARPSSNVHGNNFIRILPQ